MRKRSHAPGAHDHVVDDEMTGVAVRRSPRYGRFLLLGVAVGVVGALIATALAIATGEGPASAGLGGVLRVFGVMAAAFIAIGLTVAGLLAIALDRLLGRRPRDEVAGHETVIVDDLRSPLTDQVPRRPWVDDRG